MVEDLFSAKIDSTMKGLCAFALCRLIHYGDLDKGGQPYHLHPESVAAEFDNGKCRIVAFLHDTVEDHPEKISLEYIREFFDGEVADAVDAISKRKSETYKEYIARVKLNEIARLVKIADLKHNMQVDRLPNGGKGYESLMRRFAAALKYLTE